MIRITDIKVTTTSTGTIEFYAGMPVRPSPFARILGALLWVASIEAFGAA